MKMGVERENLSSSVRALHLIDTKYRERTAIPQLMYKQLGI